MYQRIFIYRKIEKAVLEENLEYSFKIGKYANKHLEYVKYDEDIILVVDKANESFHQAKLLKSEENENGDIKITIRILKNFINSSRKFLRITEKYYKSIFANNKKFFIIENSNAKDKGNTKNKINTIDDILFIFQDAYLIEDAIEFLTEIDGLAHENKKFIYRGQANKKFGLQASIFRNKYDENKERDIYCKLKKYNYKDFFIKEKLLDELVHMQHYGVHTRLLDWSNNPLIALFFAVTGEKNNDGKVFMYSPDEIINFNDDDYSKISELLEADFFGGKLYSEDIKLLLTRVYKMFMDNKNYFFVETVFENERIKAQQGCFSLLIDMKKKYMDIIEKDIFEDITDKVLKKNMHKGLFKKGELKENRRALKNIIATILYEQKDDFMENTSIEKIKKRVEQEIIISASDEMKGKKIKIDIEIFNEIKIELRKIFDLLKAQDYNMKLKEDSLTTFIIPHSKKNKIKEQLSVLGINSITVYPDVQGYIQYIQEEWS